MGDVRRALEDYFTFLAPDDIRLKGTRVGVETILYDYIHRGRAPEEIAQTYQRALTLEQVYATILYYLHNKEAMSAYVADWLEWGRQQRRAQEAHPSPLVLRVRQLQKQRAAQKDADACPLSIGWCLGVAIERGHGRENPPVTSRRRA